LLNKERKIRKGLWKEEEEINIKDHRQREENMAYPREYLIYMEDRLKKVIGSVIIRKFDVDYNTFMKLGRKRNYKWKFYNSKGRWQCRNKLTWKAY
jgi:hypothetical protein